MKHNLHSLFAGNFLIHPGYASSFVPVIYKMLSSKSEVSADNEYEQRLRENAFAKAEAPASSSSDKSVVVLSIKHPIAKFSDYWMGILGSKSLIRLLNSYRNDASIAGIVLDIDSGGGQVYGTGEFYDFIKDYSKPIVTYTDGYLCSAAYYIGNAASYIVANKRADAIGSIGAYASFVDFKGLWEKLGAKVHTMYATESTEKNREVREVMDNANYEPYIKEVLDPIVSTFHADMKATRPGLNEKVFAGNTWGADDALELGLIDEIGTIDTAILKVLELDEEQSKSKNSNTMSNKSRPKVEAVLGLSAPLVSTDKGSYLQDEQLDTLESSLEAAETATATVQGQLDTATASLTQAQADLTAAQTAHTNETTATTTAVDALVTAAGITATGTVTEKLSALGSHYAVINKKDGAAHTNPKIDTNQLSEAVKSVGGIDVTGALNN